MPEKKLNIQTTEGWKIITDWMASGGMEPFGFQAKTWDKFAAGYSGMVIAPTGFGKTYSVFLGVLMDFMNHPQAYNSGLKLLWITPLRSLAKDIARAMEEAIQSIGLDWTVGVRNGDTDPKIKQQQSRKMPDILLVTPESLQLLIAQKDNTRHFSSLACVCVDEWHELLGTKRGVIAELSIAYLRKLQPKLRVWGITATIGNIDEAMEVLLTDSRKKCKIVSAEKKKVDILSVFPDEVEILPWAGHLGGKLADKIVPVILNSGSAIVFTNTRSQSEMWYQILLDAYPDFAGQLAIHHSSIDAELRIWIEENLSSGALKAVVSTSSLDLGVDFKPVDTVIQIGSVKGVARFLQRAGRSGHSPFETSKIYCVPTHSLELIEVAALKEAVKKKQIEPREPLLLCFDVLIQFLVSMAVGTGFRDEDFEWIRRVYSFRMMEESDWEDCINFITHGGRTLKNYEEFHRVVKTEEGLYKVTSRKIAFMHRLNMGVIVSDAMLKVKLLSGGYLGMVEEYFVSRLEPGSKFIIAGRVVEVVHFKEMTVIVKPSKGKAYAVNYLGGRLPLSSNLGNFLRKKLSDALHPAAGEKELRFLHPLLKGQENVSHIPREDEFLVELIHTKEGYHLFMYPFEGRLVHEVMAALIAYRISRITPITFTMAMNDYGFELFSDREIPVNEDNLKEILKRENLMTDVAASINAAEMARRKFRDIAVISGMVIQNFPGKKRNNKSLQASAGLLFNVLEEHDPHHILVRQAYAEVFNQQLEEPRLQEAFRRIQQAKIIFREAESFTPLSFPIKVDSLRQSLSSEDLDARIARLQKEAMRDL